jgi:hypothetical protein
MQCRTLSEAAGSAEADKVNGATAMDQVAAAADEVAGAVAAD